MRERITTVTRRLVTVTLYASLWVLAVAGLPLLLPLAVLADALRGRRRWPTPRCLAFFIVYLTCEIAGVTAAAALWLGSAVWSRRGARRTPAARLTGLPDAYLHANFRLQCWWARTLYRGAELLFGMRTTVTGDAAVARAPYLLFLRHASTGDTLLPAVFIADRHAIALRYVMKRELRWDPCLDVVGSRLPNCFVRRGSGDSEREIAGVQRLLDELGPTDAVLIYPEGTRFDPAKRNRIVARLAGAASPRVLAMARALQHTLPPRLGGPLGLLEKRPDLDVVFCAHTGFEGAATFRDLLDGALIGREVSVTFWRVPAAAIPRDRGARAEWLYAEWLRVDAWIDQQRGGAPTVRPASASA